MRRRICERKKKANRRDRNSTKVREKGGRIERRNRLQHKNGWKSNE